MNRIIYHFLALVPPALIILSTVFSFVGGLFLSTTETSDEIFLLTFVILMAASIIMLILGWTSIIVYAIHAYKHLPEEERTLWIVLILFASPIAVPLYWYKNILNHA